MHPWWKIKKAEDGEQQINPSQNRATQKVKDYTQLWNCTVQYIAQSQNLITLLV